jgi:hypothetical protein
MELLDIIYSTLKLFSLLAVILVAISYLIFKIKDHKRPKPYFSLANSIPQENISDKTLEPIASKKMQILNESIYPASQNYHESSEGIVLEKLKVNVIQASNVKNNFHEGRKAEKLNIFDRYSNSIEPMHKIKF